MAITTLQVTQTGATIQVTTAHTYAKWVEFQNNAAAAMRIGDVNTSSSQGINLASAGGSFLAPVMRSAENHDLSQWYTNGTNTQKLDIVYDSVD